MKKGRPKSSILHQNQYLASIFFNFEYKELDLLKQLLYLCVYCVEELVRDHQFKNKIKEGSLQKGFLIIKFSILIN